MISIPWEKMCDSHFRKNHAVLTPVHCSTLLSAFTNWVPYTTTLTNMDKYLINQIHPLKCKCHQGLRMCMGILQVVIKRCCICFFIICSVLFSFFPLMLLCLRGYGIPGFRAKCHVVFLVCRVRIIVFMRMGRLCGRWQTESPRSVEKKANARASLRLFVFLSRSLHLSICVSWCLSIYSSFTQNVAIV